MSGAVDDAKAMVSSVEAVVAEKTRYAEAAAAEVRDHEAAHRAAVEAHGAAVAAFDVSGSESDALAVGAASAKADRCARLLAASRERAGQHAGELASAREALVRAQTDVRRAELREVAGLDQYRARAAPHALAFVEGLVRCKLALESLLALWHEANRAGAELSTLGDPSYAALDGVHVVLQVLELFAESGTVFTPNDFQPLRYAFQGDLPPVKTLLPGLLAQLLAVQARSQGQPDYADGACRETLACMALARTHVEAVAIGADRANARTAAEAEARPPRPRPKLRDVMNELPVTRIATKALRGVFRDGDAPPSPIDAGARGAHGNGVSQPAAAPFARPGRAASAPMPSPMPGWDIK